MSLPPSILACATCLADKDSAIGQAQGYAILFLLFMLAFMFAGLFAIVRTIMRRQHQHTASLPA
jgi:hypothetical protein